MTTMIVGFLRNSASPHPEDRPEGASRRVGRSIVVAHPSGEIVL